MEQVYRFRVALKFQKKLWRRIEIKGSQTLDDFDGIIRDAFRHGFDHLSMFFRGRVWRSEDLGEINPFDGGVKNTRRIDRLGLREGDKMEYVYDFGDDVQHIVTLEKIMPAVEGIEYPRIFSQNKPKYKYCEKCDRLGKKVIATCICVDCSNEEGREVLLCDECATDEPEDHYVVEKLY